MNEQWNQARVRVSADEARHADPKPSAPPVPPVAFGGAPIRTAPKTRTIVAVGLALAAGGMLTVLVIAAAVVIGSSNQGDFPRRKTSVRAPSAAEEVSIDAGELGLVAPQVEGRGGLGSEWSGSAVPWMVSRDGKLVLATNAHVAKGDGLAPASLQIRFPAGKSLPVTAVAVANEPRIDVALMVVDAKGLKESVDFRCLTPGLEADWAALKPGLEVVAVGTPLGCLRLRHSDGFRRRGIGWTICRQAHDGFNMTPRRCRATAAVRCSVT